MLQYVIKIVLTTIIVVAVAEIGKRDGLWAAVFASLPLTSLLAFVWIYVDTGDTGRIASMSMNIVWLVLASLPLFLLLVALLRAVGISGRASPSRARQWPLPTSG